MFSSKALASTFRIFSIRCLVALCLVLAPQLVSAQTGGTGGSNEDPPPVWYRPGPVTDDPSSLDTFLCRTESTDGSGELFCAGELTLDSLATADVTSADPTLLTFVLDSHETVQLSSAGAVDVRGEIRDAHGARLASNDNGIDGRNFRMTRTLGPGRYYVKVTGVNGAAGKTTLQVDRITPRHGGAHFSFADWAGDLGNHCGAAAALSATSRTASTFDGPGDLDVFAVEVNAAGKLLIDVDGDARYELKAADCATSFGLASASFGSTLVDVAAGTYYLYVSQGPSAAERYEVHLELR